MSSFNKRKRDAEDRFKHDQELEFKANARRNKLLGLWAMPPTPMPRRW
jgi:hypothetical protein